MASATVVGAGVFGSAVARSLALRDWRVTLAEQYTPGHVRSGSGGDTRLLRAAHGEAEWYTQLAWDAHAMWLSLERETGLRLFEPVGLAWFAHTGDGFEARSRLVLERLGIPCDWLDPQAAGRLFPGGLRTDGLEGVLLEPEAGVLHARRATRLLASLAEGAGATLVHERPRPSAPPGGDVVVWACGSWLPALFPSVVDVRISRRDVFFFGGGPDWETAPGFCDYDGAFYGHGEIDGLGVKISSDQDGPEIDPDTLERLPSARSEGEARAYALERFPGLAYAPIVGGRVCQYDLTVDGHFLVARHPENENWWLVGGGSGHGFKHGPALGEYIADCVEGRREPEPFHALGPRTGNAGLRTSGAT